MTDTPRPTNPYPEIKGHRCPACGGSLFVGEGGYITCSWYRCPSPDYEIVLAGLGERLAAAEPPATHECTCGTMAWCDGGGNCPTDPEPTAEVDELLANPDELLGQAFRKILLSDGWDYIVADEFDVVIDGRWSAADGLTDAELALIASIVNEEMS